MTMTHNQIATADLIFHRELSEDGVKYNIIKNRYGKMGIVDSEYILLMLEKQKDAVQDLFIWDKLEQYKKENELL